jgi:hypothetical protein
VSGGASVGRAVDQFPDQVGMPVVPGVLLDRVLIDPAHRALDALATAHANAEVIEAVGAPNGGVHRASTDETISHGARR